MNLEAFWLLAFGTSFHSTSTKEPAYRALMGVAALACDQWRPCDPVETKHGASQKEKKILCVASVSCCSLPVHLWPSMRFLESSFRASPPPARAWSKQACIRPMGTTHYRP